MADTYHVKDHVVREAVNRLRDTALEFHAHGSLRERLARELEPLLVASRPAEVDDEGLPALPASAKLTIYELQREPYFTAEQFRQGQRDAVAADRARREKLPANADEMVAFIGSHYNSMRYEKPDPNDIVYELTVHDLLSAFRWWFDEFELEDEPSDTTNKEKG